ncbi:MAG: nucleotidyltransferase domain-containing protein [Cellulosilyticaceae bacterium]
MYPIEYYQQVQDYHFKCIVADEKYSKIHPVKQRKVYELVQALLAEDIEHKITEIIVFGSCITFACNSYSDIDLLVLGEFEEFDTKIHLYQYGEVDLLGYNRDVFMSQLETNKFFKGVWEGGYRIYE